MKTITLLVFFSLILTTSYAQDGSDTRYVKVQNVDSTFIGQDVQFDFFNRSFGGQTLDTINIIIDGKPIKFIEVRKDNGYNNWFSQQCLQSADKIDGQTIRIPKLRLDSITATSFRVTMFVDYYDKHNKLQAEKSRQIEYWFDKNDITEVLVHSKQQ